MELFEALLKRRSVRKFTNQEVTDEQINKILHAAMSGPSAMNKQPWEFYVVKNKEILEKVHKSARYSDINGNIAIIVCGNQDRFLSDEVKDFWIEDASAATENILLAATALGLGSLWCGIYPDKGNVERLQNALNLDKKLIPLNIIYIGYAEKEPDARDQYDEKLIHIIK